MHKAFENLSPSIEERIAKVQDILGYEFTDKTLVSRALTHPSAVEADPSYSYERLEFLGDAIVDLIVAEEAYQRFRDADEGTLTKIRISVVNGAVLSVVATGLGLDKLIVFGQSEKASAHRGIRSATGDVFEALTAALYLDGGIKVARNWVIECLGLYITEESAQAAASPKSKLQEKMQALGKSVTYQVVSETGPAHAPSFVCEVLIDGEAAGRGNGETKKQAEAAAASVVLSQGDD